MGKLESINANPKSKAFVTSLKEIYGKDFFSTKRKTEYKYLCVDPAQYAKSMLFDDADIDRLRNVSVDEILILADIEI